MIFNVVWKLVRGDGGRGMIARFDAIEQLAAGSMAARRISPADQPATGEWGPAMRRKP